MQRNVLLAALLVVLAGVFVWLLRESNDVSTGAATARGTNPEPADERALPDGVRDVARADEAPERSAVAAADATAAAPELDSQPVVAPAPALEGELVELRVVERGSQKPVTGARVVRFENPERNPAFDMARVVRRGDFDAQFEASQSAQITDVDGIVHFPRAREVTVVAARFERKLGLVNVSPDTFKPIVIELVADGDITVRTVDVLGHAASGVPVALRRGTVGMYNDYSLAETDSEGGATLRHALAFVLARPKPVPWRVALRGVFDPAIKVDVDAAIQAGATAQLVVPMHGECEVEVLDEQGALCTQPLSVGLRVLRDQQPPPIQGWFVSDGGVRFEDVVTGKQLFRIVQLGSALEAFVTRDGSDVVHRVQCNALTKADQRVQITLKLAETACVLTGRVVDETGQALGAASIRARTQRPDQRGGVDYSESALALDAQGRFRFDIDVSRGTAPTSFAVYTCDAGQHEQLSAARDLPASLGVGVHDLGDLALELSPRIAAGIVLDHHGQAVAGATIHVSVEDREETDSFPNVLDLPDARSDANGRFDIRARIALPAIAVSATHDGRTSNTVTTRPAASDLVLRFVASGNVAGRVLLDDALGKLSALIEVRYADQIEGEDPPPNRRVMLDKNSTFELRGLRAGTYEVRVNTPTNWIPLARVTDVVVETDRTSRDPRLDPLDLRGQLLSFTLRIVDARDAPVPQSWLVVHRAELGDETFDDSNALGNTIKHGVICGLAGVDVRAGAPGMRDVELHAVKSNTTLVLAPGPRVRLQLKQPAPLSAPLELRPQLVPADQTRPRIASKGEPARFGLDGVAHLAAPLVGRARVQFVLVHPRGPNGSSEAEVQTTTPQFIDIHDEPGEQSFEVSFDPVDLEAVQRQIAGG